MNQDVRRVGANPEEWFNTKDEDLRYRIFDYFRMRRSKLIEPTRETTLPRDEAKIASGEAGIPDPRARESL